MSKPTHPMGSLAWLEHIFSTSPVRTLKGPSKPTQFHQMWSEHIGRFIGAQGRNETNCMLMLEHLANLGFIRRFKEQPFRTLTSEFGYEIVPDYLATGNANEIYVIEAKSARYLTAEVQATFARNRAKFAESNITYLIWTDRQPLNKHVRHSLLEMRRLSYAVPHSETVNLKTHLKNCGIASFDELLNEGYDQGVVFAATWKGDCYFRFTEEFGPETPVSAAPLLDLRSIFLSGNGEGTGWWNMLPNM